VLKPLQLFEEWGELRSSEIRAEVRAESARRDLKFAVNPVAIRVVEEPWMTPG
jgi:hypothetical protein